jgi:transcriptional regulator GlxA family with amidase domain
VRNRAVPFAAICQDQILKGEIQAVECRLAQASGTAERIACVESFLAKLLRCSNEPDAIVTAALGLIKDSKGQISVEGLSAALGINGRQLERKFTQHVGLSPKAFCRVTRFRQVKLLLEKNNEPSGCALAYTCGYYDQTHFIREFRVFTGKTPARYAWAQPVGFFLYDHQPTCYL